MSTSKYRTSYSSAYDAAPRRKHRPADAGSILEKVLKQHGLYHKVAEYRFVKQWSEIIGSEGAKRSFPEYIRGKTLVVRVNNSLWAQEFTFEKTAILARLHRVVGNTSMVNDIQFHVGELPLRSIRAASRPD
jgi:predicted nucleic acid-binding Zn ribbon protein